MNIKDKLLATLLIFVFLVSISAVVAQDTADISDNLAVENVDDAIAVSEDAEPLTVESDEESVTADGVDSETTSLSVEVEVLDKNVKVGDTFRVKVTVRNTGENHAESVVAGVAFGDLNEKLDASFKLVDDDGYEVYTENGVYVIPLGFLGAGDYEEIVLTFMATEPGEKIIAATVLAENSEEISVANTTITVSGDSSNHAAAASKTLPATGNPLVLLAIALICIVPYCRRK